MSFQKVQLLFTIEQKENEIAKRLSHKKDIICMLKSTHSLAHVAKGHNEMKILICSLMLVALEGLGASIAGGSAVLRNTNNVSSFKS